MILSDLRQYPLKSARGFSLPEARVTRAGLDGDRRFMLTHPDGRFITQRELGALAQVEARVDAGGRLQLRHGARQASARFDPARRLVVTVWDSTVDAALADDAANAAVSGWLGLPVCIVQMDARAHREASADWAPRGSPVGFADGFQILVTTTASLSDLNLSMQKAGEAPVGMDRFRPNLIIETAEPWDEDFWQTIQIGGVVFDLVKPCSRCVMTTLDQITGARTGGNPLKGLLDKRLSTDPRVTGPLFGWNAVPRGEGRLEIGAPVRVLERRPDRWAMKVRA